MLHRNAKAGDYHEGKWNGLGGKLEPDESPLEAAIRELEEEAGLKLSADAFTPLGALQFPNFKPHKSEDWLVFVFEARVAESGKPWARGPEGDLEWIARERVLSLNLWEGDRHFIPYVLAAKPFVGTIWYDGPRVARHWIAPLAGSSHLA
jgi:8-oxo-dGTP diphosphatase